MPGEARRPREVCANKRYACLLRPRGARRYVQKNNQLRCSHDNMAKVNFAEGESQTGGDVRVAF